MSIYRNDDILITDLMDRIDKLENQVTDLKKVFYKQSGESHSTFLLICEADNKYDKNAISVATPAGLKLGYIPREHNLIFSRLIDSGNLLFGRVKNFHWDGKNLELVIKVYLAN